MRKQSITLFIVYPTVSHYYSIAPLAKKYQMAGGKVVMSGINKHQILITSLGFDYVPLKYYQGYNINSFRTAFWIFLASFFLKFRNNQKNSFNHFKYGLRSMVKHVNPDHILIDAHLAFYYACLEQDVTVTILHTKLSSLRSRCIPPLSSSIVVKDTKVYDLLCMILWIWSYVQTGCRYFLRRLVLHFQDEKYYLDIELRKSGRCFKDVFLPLYAAPFYLQLNISAIKSSVLIIADKKVEYQWQKLRDFERYVNLPILYRAENKLDLIELEEALSVGNNKVVYCSFGTITGNYAVKIKKFVNKVIKCSVYFPQYLFIISMGSLANDFSHKPKNVILSQYVPQQVILSAACLMITHGGMNSVRECLHFGVPMLVYPLNKKFDQPGNAARIVHHGWGLKGNMDRATVYSIKRKIKDCLQTKIVIG